MTREELTVRIETAANHLRSLGAKEVYVFGSAARGELRRFGDVDLAVVGLPDPVFFRAIAETSEIVGRPVDLTCLDKPDPLSRYLRESRTLRRVG